MSKNFNFEEIDFNYVVTSLTGHRIVSRAIPCPFHDDDEPSCQINNESSSQGKGFHCHGCGETGDPINFVMKVKNCTFLEAVKELGLTHQLTPKDRKDNNLPQSHRGKIYEYLHTLKDYRSLCDIYDYTDELGNLLYCKVKYKTPEDKKKYFACTFPEGKLIVSLGNVPRVPYNLTELDKRLRESYEGIGDNRIFITEGEKDTKTIRKLGYFATSLIDVVKKDNSGLVNYLSQRFDPKSWNISDMSPDSVKPSVVITYNRDKWKTIDLYFCGDTGKAGNKYREDVWNALGVVVRNFYVVELPNIEKLGDNKDITDWIESYKDFDEASRMFDIASNRLHAWNWKLSRLWRHMNLNTKGTAFYPSPISVHNVQHYLKYLGISIKHEAVTGEAKVKGALETYVDNKGTLYKAVIRDGMHRAGCKVDKDTVTDALEYIYDANSYNYFQEICIEARNSNHYLIDKLIDCLHLPNELQKRLTRKALFSYVNQGFNNMEDQYVAQGILVIRGDQGLGKSNFVKSLALRDPRFYFSSDGLSFENPDSVRKHVSRNLVELTELLLTSKHEIEGFKNFLDKYADYRRKLYKEEMGCKVRHTFYIATTNETNFQKDPTGSRRFWVIEPQATITQPEDAGIDVKEVLGAIYDILADKTVAERKALCGLTREEIIEVNNANARYYTGGNVGAVIEEVFDTSTAPTVPVTKNELYRLLSYYNITLKEHNNAVENYFKSHALKIREGGGLPIIKINGNRLRGYKLWKIHPDWEPFINPTSSKDRNQREEMKFEAIKLRDEINSRIVDDPKKEDIKVEINISSDNIDVSDKVIDLEQTTKILEKNEILRIKNKELEEEKKKSEIIVKNIEEERSVLVEELNKNEIVSDDGENCTFVDGKKGMIFRRYERFIHQTGTLLVVQKDNNLMLIIRRGVEEEREYFIVTKKQIVNKLNKTSAKDCLMPLSKSVDPNLYKELPDEHPIKVTINEIDTMISEWRNEERHFVYREGVG